MTPRWALLTLAAAACSPSVSGEVRDATSGRPIAHAMVDVTTTGWGTRGGGLVWDKDYSYRAQTAADGQFRVAGADGGHRLTVSAPGYAAVQTSLCSRSPMTIWVGGPFDGGDFGKQLSIGTNQAGARVGWRFDGKGSQVPESDADLTLVSFPADPKDLELEAPSGMAFRGGTGNPPLPPSNGYARRMRIGPLECGWLFVRTRGSGTIPVRTGNLATMESPEIGRAVLLSYAVPRG